MKLKSILALLLCSALLASCKNKEDDDSLVDTVNESAQQVGDVVASIDESGGTTTGSFTQMNDVRSAQKAFARLSGESHSTSVASLILPESYAAACNTVAFGTCGATGSGKLVRNFASCTTGGGGTISGDVTLTFVGSVTATNTCRLAVDNDYVDRVPNFTISGLRGATFSVSATGSGQRLTRNASNTFTFTNSGIRRTFSTANLGTLLDVTTSTSGAVTVTGSARNGRTMTASAGNGIVVTNNLTSESCTLTPSGVAWTSGCNCPTTGSFSGTCTGAGTTFSVTFGSTCGSVTVAKTGEETETITLDRCSL